MSGRIDWYDVGLVVGVLLIGVALYVEAGPWSLVGYGGGLLAVFSVALAWRNGRL